MVHSSVLDPQVAGAGHVTSFTACVALVWWPCRQRRFACLLVAPRPASAKDPEHTLAEGAQSCQVPARSPSPLPLPSPGLCGGASREARLFLVNKGC